MKIKNDGSIVATSSDNSILMWNENGDLFNTITLDTAATQLAISPNGKHLYTAEQGKIVIRDSQTGNFIHDALNSSMFSKIKFSRNGRWVVTINSQYPKQVAEPHKQIVKIWDMTTEELINTINCDTYDGYFSTEISEDGKTLIVTCAEIFGNNIKFIGECAFGGCFGLQSVSLPIGIKVIENDTFCACSKLKEVNIPNTVTSIGRGAFFNCPTLSKIVIPDSVKTIEENAFEGCIRLRNVTISQLIPTHMIDSAFDRSNTLVSFYKNVFRSFLYNSCRNCCTLI